MKRFHRKIRNLFFSYKTLKGFFSKKFPGLYHSFFYKAFDSPGNFFWGLFRNQIVRVSVESTELFKDSPKYYSFLECIPESFLGKVYKIHKNVGLAKGNILFKWIIINYCSKGDTFILLYCNISKKCLLFTSKYVFT